MKPRISCAYLLLCPGPEVRVRASARLEGIHSKQATNSTLLALLVVSDRQHWMRHTAGALRALEATTSLRFCGLSGPDDEVGLFRVGGQKRPSLRTADSAPRLRPAPPTPAGRWASDDSRTTSRATSGSAGPGPRRRMRSVKPGGQH